MATNYMMTAEEMAQELRISKAMAYKLIKQFNNELSKKGYMVVTGKISRKYIEERFYGISLQQEGA